MAHVLLTGLSGSGKSTVGEAYAKRIGKPFIDLDQQIEQRSGKTVSDWFAHDGEAAFRKIERETLAYFQSHDDAVIALGGGAMASPEGVKLAHRLGQIVWLALPPQRLAERLNNGPDRPLLQGDRVERLRQQHRDRAAHYAHAHHVVWAEGTVDEVCDRMAEQMANASRIVSVQSHRGLYPVRVGAFSDHALAVSLAAFANRGPVALVVDSAVRKRAEILAAHLQSIGVRTVVSIVQAGERFKRLDAIEALAEWLAAQECDRSSVVIAMGGGSVTDAVGFTASVYMRGLPWVSVPTTMLGLVDSGLGGKVGANLGKGKNLLGAFYPPQAVIADLSWLSSLPKTEVRAGLAEMLKVAATHDADYFAVLEKMGDAQIQPEALLERIARAVALKGEVVSADEFEHGLRKVLNFGHTFGHAFESAAGLSGLRHGEAVALGMLAETEFAVGRSHADAQTLTRLHSAVRALGLPAEWRSYAKAGASFVGRDKKRVDDHIQIPVVRQIGKFDWDTASVAEMVNFLEVEGARS